MSDDFKVMLRSLYDRGILSKQTFLEVVGETDFSQERERRNAEKQRGDDKTFYPPIIQNLEQHPNDVNNKEEVPSKIEDEEKDASPDKKGPEKRNYNQSLLENAECPKCGEVFDFESEKEVAVETIECPNCEYHVSKKEILNVSEQEQEYEEAPYNKISELPDNIKNVMSNTLQKVWMDVFNDAYPQGEDYARKVAWSVIKKIARKNKKGKWVKKRNTAELDDIVISAVKDITPDETTLDDVYKMKKIEFLEKKQELLNKLFNKEDNNEDTAER